MNPKLVYPSPVQQGDKQKHFGQTDFGKPLFSTIYNRPEVSRGGGGGGTGEDGVRFTNARADDRTVFLMSKNPKVTYRLRVLRIYAVQNEIYEGKGGKKRKKVLLRKKKNNNGPTMKPTTKLAGLNCGAPIFIKKKNQLAPL